MILIVGLLKVFMGKVAESRLGLVRKNTLFMCFKEKVTYITAVQGCLAAKPVIQTKEAAGSPVTLGLLKSQAAIRCKHLTYVCIHVCVYAFVSNMIHIQSQKNQSSREIMLHSSMRYREAIYNYSCVCVCHISPVCTVVSNHSCEAKSVLSIVSM